MKNSKFSEEQIDEAVKSAIEGFFETLYDSGASEDDCHSALDALSERIWDTEYTAIVIQDLFKE